MCDWLTDFAETKRTYPNVSLKVRVTVQCGTTFIYTRISYLHVYISV